MPSLQAICKTPLKPSNAKLSSSLKAESMENREIIEQIALVSVLADAIPTCELPTVLQIDADFRSLDAKARDDFIPLFTAASEQLSQAISKHTNGKAITAILTTDSEPLKRTRRATEDVIYS